MEQLFSFIERAWPYALVAGPGLFALWKYYRDAELAKARLGVEDRRDRQDLIKIAQEAAGEVIDELRQEAARLRERLETVEAELQKVRKDNADMMAAKDAKITMLEGENRQLQQRLRACEHLLERHHIPAPRQGETYWEMDDGGLRPIETAKGQPA